MNWIELGTSGIGTAVALGLTIFDLERSVEFVEVHIELVNSDVHDSEPFARRDADLAVPR